MGDLAAEREQAAPKCDCSLLWRYRKGNGPDPANCAIHGDRRTTPEQERA